MTTAEASKDKSKVKDINKYNEKRDNQALMTAIAMKGKTAAQKSKKKGKGKGKATAADLNDEEDIHDDIIIIGEEREAGPSTPLKRRRLNDEQIQQRREALDRDFGAAMIAAEAERANQHVFLDRLRDERADQN